MIEQKIYNEIKKIFPLNAVELLVLNQMNEVLMVKRENEPAKNKWWIPGGRVWFAEGREDAVKRLLKNECGIDKYILHESEMFEYAVKNHSENYQQHIISTVYKVKISGYEIRLDSQSSGYKWKPASEWIKDAEHDFLLKVLNGFKADEIFLHEEKFNSSGNEFIRNDLYSTILNSLPIPCVDLLVKDENDKILLVKRKNEPAQNEWWVPGGRVLFGEKRADTAKRKLKEECSLEGDNYKMIGNFEFVYKIAPEKIIHNISTLYSVDAAPGNTAVDEQSYGFDWRTAEEWLKEPMHEFMIDVLKYKSTDGKIQKRYY